MSEELAWGFFCDFIWDVITRWWQYLGGDKITWGRSWILQIFFLWKCQGKNLHGDESSGDENSAMKVPSSNVQAKNIQWINCRTSVLLITSHLILQILQNVFDSRRDATCKRLLCPNEEDIHAFIYFRGLFMPIVLKFTTSSTYLHSIVATKNFFKKKKMFNTFMAYVIRAEVTK